MKLKKERREDCVRLPVENPWFETQQLTIEKALLLVFNSDLRHLKRQE